MNRRQLAFVILVNAAISLVIALAVVWLFESRRPDPTALTTLLTPGPGAILAPTAAADVTVLPTPPTEPEVLGAGEPAVTVAGDAAGTGDENGEAIHIVQAGESLGSIAAQYGVSIDRLVQANDLIDPDFVFSGQRLRIPPAAGGNAPGTGGAANATQGSVEILAVEGAGDLAREAVLIANESDTPFDLTDWQLSRENGPVYTFGNVQLFPGSSVRVYSAAGEDNSIALYWSQAEPVWTSGSTAELRNANSALVDTFTPEP